MPKPIAREVDSPGQWDGQVGRATLLLVTHGNGNFVTAGGDVGFSVLAPGMAGDSVRFGLSDVYVPEYSVDNGNFCGNNEVNQHDGLLASGL